MNIIKNWLYKPRPRVYSKFAVETIACMMFHFIGSVTGTPWGNGIALTVLVYYIAKTSSAHMNPSLSLTFMLLGYINILELFVYWAAQIIGSVLGALWLALLVPGLHIGATAYDNKYSGCFIPAIGLSQMNVFGWEALCTFNFIVPIFSVVWYTFHKKGYGNTGPLLIGLSLTCNAMAASSFSGGALNPSRVLGSFLVFDCGNKEYILYYITGELLGGLIAPICIMPWYGICVNSWYLQFIPMFMKKHMKYYQDNLKIDGDEEDDNKEESKSDISVV